ncbi:Protein OS-9 [Rhizoctonia solani]
MTLSRPLVSLAVAWSFWIHRVQAYNSLPEDIYAYPKYTIGFLNGLPLPNVTAQQWLAYGLKGGEKEFLEQPWDQNSHGTSRPQITGGETINSDGPANSHPASHRLERMRLGPGKEYLCLIPPPDQGSPSFEDATPPPSHPRLKLTLFVDKWEAYNLGVSPAAKLKGGSDVSRQAESAAANLELQRAADQRYLVQRWGDGTQCDKTGRKRQIEIQIMFVKEVSVCNYLIVIHTPRICSEPGFKSQRDSVKAAPIRCRQVVPESTVEFDRTLLESPVPRSVPPVLPILPPAPPIQKETQGNSGDKKAGPGGGKKSSTLGEDEKQAEFVKVALGALFNAHTQDRALAGKKVRVDVDGDVHELDFTEVGLDSVATGDVPDMNTLQERLAKALRAAGYDLQADGWPEEPRKGVKGKSDKKSKEDRKREEVNHQEL